MPRAWKRVATVWAVVAVLLAAGYGYYRYQFPYGWSHSCDLILGGELRLYAEEHEGWFPRGEETPEASLGLLYQQDPWNAGLLCGKTIPASAVRDRLASGGKLTPDLCGWHYVEGLRSDDDPRLALFWDKAGLGHNGERLSGGGHFVGFVNGNIDYIPGDRWDEFLGEQERLRAGLKRPR